MSQNTSSAVMQQRRDRARASLDDFPTPPWATRACIEHVVLPLTGGAVESAGGGGGSFLGMKSATDPCCNRGHMVRPLLEHFGQVRSVDIADYTRDPRPALVVPGRGPGSAAAPSHPPASPAVEAAASAGRPFEQDGVGDFLMPGWAGAFPRAAAADWFFMNPPFKLAEAFIDRALGLAREGVAVFIRSAFPEGQGRYERLFRGRPPAAIAYFAERVVLHEGVLRDPDIDYWDARRGIWTRPTTATGSLWMVWTRDKVGDYVGWGAGQSGARAMWIPPCRQQMTRPNDYPVNPDQRGVFTPPPARGQQDLGLSDSRNDGSGESADAGQEAML